MTFADGAAVVAIGLSLFTILLGVLFYKWQGDLAREMRSVLAEIKGLTIATLGELQEQFKWLLQARVGQERASLAEDVAERLQSLENAFADLASKAAGRPDDQLSADIEELKERVASLSSELSAAARKDAAAAWPGPAPRSETPFVDKALQEAAYDAWRRYLASKVEPKGDEPKT